MSILLLSYVSLVVMFNPDGWMDDCLTVFQSYQDNGKMILNGRLSGMEPCLWLERFPPRAGLKRRTIRSVVALNLLSDQGSVLFRTLAIHIIYVNRI